MSMAENDCRFTAPQNNNAFVYDPHNNSLAFNKPNEESFLAMWTKRFIFRRTIDKKRVVKHL